MKFSIVASLLALSATAFADPQVQAEAAQEEREIVTDPNFVPSPEKPFNFQIDYSIAFKEDTTTGAIEDLLNGETIELVYEFKSLEPTEVSIVGVGGEMLDPVTGETMANITASQIGPISVLNNDNTTFTQRVGINMPFGQYLLVPAIYIIYQDQFMMLGSKNKIITIVEPSISFFNPQLILSEIILGVSIAGIFYVLYNMFAGKYLAGILPESLLPVEKKKAKKVKKQASESSSSSSATTSSSKQDFEAWLPDTHKTISKKQKKKLWIWPNSNFGHKTFPFPSTFYRFVYTKLVLYYYGSPHPKCWLQPRS